MTTDLQIPYYDQWLGPWAILPDALTQTLELFRKTDLHIHLQQQAARNGDWLLLPERPEGCSAQKVPVPVSRNPVPVSRDAAASTHRLPDALPRARAGGRASFAATESIPGRDAAW